MKDYDKSTEPDYLYQEYEISVKRAKRRILIGAAIFLAALFLTLIF